MAYIFIKTNEHAFIIEEISNANISKEIIYGNALYLFAQRVITEKNPKGVMKYSKYVTQTPVHVCHKDDVIENRPANELEINLFLKLRHKDNISNDDRKYLKENHFVDNEVEINE